MALVGLIECPGYENDIKTPPVLYHPEWPDHPFLIDEADLTARTLYAIYWQCDCEHDHSDVAKSIQKNIKDTLQEYAADEIKTLKKIGYTEIFNDDTAILEFKSADNFPDYVLIEYNTEKRCILFGADGERSEELSKVLYDETEILVQLMLDYKKIKKEKSILEKKIHIREQKILYAPGGEGAMSARYHFESLCGHG